MASIRAEARRAEHQRRARKGQLNLNSLAVLFAAVVALVLMFVGIVRSDSSPWFVLLPTLVGYLAIRRLRS